MAFSDYDIFRREYRARRGVLKEHREALLKEGPRAAYRSLRQSGLLGMGIIGEQRHAEPSAAELREKEERRRQRIVQYLTALTTPTPIEEWPCAGYKCEVIKYGGHYNAYVTVPPGHPEYGKSYDEVDSDMSEVPGCADLKSLTYGKAGTFGTNYAHASEEGTPLSQVIIETDALAFCLKSLVEVGKPLSSPHPPNP